MSRYYEYRHLVTFQETNLVGNVYYANHISWQGRVRELFLRDHAPTVVQELMNGLLIATTRVSCDYLAELNVFDEILIRMRLKEATQSRLTLSYEYWRQTARGEDLVARGEQQLACLRRTGTEAIPTPIPTALHHALEPFRER